MTRKEFKKVMEKVGKGEFEDFMLEVFSYNSDIEDLFRCRFVNYFPKMTKDEYSSRIMGAMYRSCNSHGYIDYSLTDVYSEAMENFISESWNLIKGGNYASALDIIESILDSIPYTNIDDSDGTTSDVADECMEVIEDILEYSLVNDKKISDRVLDYLLNEIETKALYNYGIELYSLFDYYIDDKRELDRIEKCLKDYINNHGDDRYVIAKYREIIGKIDNKRKVVD